MKFKYLVFVFFIYFSQVNSEIPGSSSENVEKASESGGTEAKPSEELGQNPYLSGLEASGENRAPCCSLGIRREEKLKLMAAKKPPSMSDRLARLLCIFLLQNAILLILVEFDVVLFGLKQLFISSYWLNTHKIEEHKRSILKSMVHYWNSSSGENTENAVVRFLISNSGSYKREVQATYNLSDEVLTTSQLIKNHLIHFDCLNPQATLALIILLFEDKFTELFNVLLLYLLICSIKIISDSNFEKRVQSILTNTRNSSLIKGISTDTTWRLLVHLGNEMQTTPKLFFGVRAAPLKHPLFVTHINGEEFGLKLCISALELSLVTSRDISLESLLIFLSSRMGTPPEILLAFEILKGLVYSVSSLAEMAAIILFDSNVSEKIKSSMLIMHNVDLSNLRGRFAECLKLKEDNDEFKKVVLRTDYQKKSGKEGSKKEKIALRSKYSFM
ncbi:secreted protein of cryptosprodidium-specific FGLN protein family [Cryptosporidium felis]|nr:secreted protein of cryptosprodidium-specific FGLN protein family [Cryptosporidium felis]